MNEWMNFLIHRSLLSPVTVYGNHYPTLNMLINHFRDLTYRVLSTWSGALIPDPIDVFPEMKLRGLFPNFHINVYVSDLYFPTTGPPVLLQQICRQIVVMYNSITDTWMEEMGTRPHSLISGNICFEFSARCLCTACLALAINKSLSLKVYPSYWAKQKICL
jgi:hypothetical protein